MSTEPKYQIAVAYQKALFRRAARAYIQSLLGHRMRLVKPLLLVAGVLSLILLTLVGSILLKGCPLPELNGTLKAMILAVPILAALVAFLYGMIYWNTIRNCEKLARKMSDPTLKMAFGDEGFSVESELATSQIQWKAFHHLLAGPDIWLLFPNQMTFYLLPTEAMPDGLQDYLRLRLEENGVKILNL